MLPPLHVTAYISQTPSPWLVFVSDLKCEDCADVTLILVIFLNFRKPLTQPGETTLYKSFFFFRLSSSNHDEYTDLQVSSLSGFPFIISHKCCISSEGSSIYLHMRS